MLAYAVAPGGEPCRQEREDGQNDEKEDREREPFAELAGDVLAAAQVHARRRLAGLARCERERERLISGEPVHPERGDPVAEYRAGVERNTHEQPSAHGGIAASFEVVPARY